MDISGWPRERLESAILSLAGDLRRAYFDGDACEFSDLSDLGQVVIGTTEIRATEKLKAHGSIE